MYNLTDRELEVLKLIIEGKKNDEIAEMLIVELTTVKYYVSSIFRKMNVKNRVAAAVKGLDIIDE